MIPLAGNNFELKQHPQTFAWYVKDLEGNMKPKYISKLELRSNAIARVAPLTPPALPPAEEGAGMRHGGVIFLAFNLHIFRSTISFPGLPIYCISPWVFVWLFLVSIFVEWQYDRGFVYRDVYALPSFYYWLVVLFSSNFGS